MFGGEYSFLVETLDELKYRRGVVQQMLADWCQEAILKDLDYDKYCENLEATSTYLDFAVATLEAVVAVAEKTISTTKTKDE